MSESFPSGRIPMVKIDGDKIRQLRESKGLTQLFLATVVEVTTDTISRWENKRYPTIKRENGIKLAEALEVELDDILDHSGTEADTEELAGGTQDQADTQTATPPAQFFGKKPLVVAAGSVLLLFVFFLWWFLQTPQDMAVSARRILPVHTVAGQPFPVAISVSTGSSISHTLILKESLPPEAVLVSAVPKKSLVGHEASLKWLSKIKEKKTFAYVVKIESPSAVSAVFSGTVAVHKAPGEEIKVSGRDRISIGEYHWADSNGDGIISDEEILTVYDEFSEISGLELDIDQVEEIWLGSGYTWDTASSSFIVLP